MTAYDADRFEPPAPVATVVIRHPERSDSAVDAVLLIDSGADVTLLPKSTVTPLGLKHTDERFQLLGFDGSVSDSEGVFAVLVFMNPRFHGRYLLTDGEVGVLGRNVLNHFRMLLDGPTQNWNVENE